MILFPFSEIISSCFSICSITLSSSCIVSIVKCAPFSTGNDCELLLFFTKFYRIHIPTPLSVNRARYARIHQLSTIPAFLPSFISEYCVPILSYVHRIHTQVPCIFIGHNPWIWTACWNIIWRNKKTGYILVTLLSLCYNIHQCFFLFGNNQSLQPNFNSSST